MEIKWAKKFGVAISLAGVSSLLFSSPSFATLSPHRSYDVIRYHYTATATAAGEPKGIPTISGSATIAVTVDVISQAFCYQVISNGVPSGVRGLLGKAPAGSSGNKVFPVASVEFNSKRISCISAKVSILEDIVKSPSNYYFEIQKRKAPFAGIRGQLQK
jgi:hypothetical protein